MNTPRTPKITHQNLVAALAKNGGEILASLTPFKCHLWHMASCLPGEAAELLEAFTFSPPDRVNILEELGDIEFYMEGIRAALDIQHVPQDPALAPPQGVDFRAGQISIIAGAIFDIVKKHCIYNKDLATGDLEKTMHKLDLQLAALREVFQFTRQDVLDANIAKLSKRYGEKYSDAAAQARADKNS